MAKEILDILLDLGYSPKREMNGWRMARVYANGDNPTSLFISNDGRCHDFVANESFDFNILVQRTLNLPNTKATEDWLKKNEFLKPCKGIPEARIKMKKTYDKSSLDKLIAKHDYWVDRKISVKTLETFGGGVSLTGGSKDRYVFPVWDNKKEIVGFAARDITNTKSNKWKLFGGKAEWVWPAHVNCKNIQDSKTIILVESIGDFLALWESGIKCGVVLFGTAISWKIINFIIYCNPKNIVISTNNDEAFRDSQAGNAAAQEIYRKLCKYVDRKTIHIVMPDKAKDLNDQLISHGTDSIVSLYKRFL